MVIQPANHINTGRSRVRQILPLAQGGHPGGHRTFPVAEAHVIHAGIVTDQTCEGGLPGMGGGAVHPDGNIDLRVGFAAQVIHLVHRDFRGDGFDDGGHFSAELFAAARLKAHIAHGDRVLQIQLVRHIQMERRFETRLAAVTGTHSINAAVIPRCHKARHIAVQTVKGVGGQQLGQNLQDLLLLVFTILAGLDKAVLIDDAAVCGTECPIRMLFIHRIGNFGKVHPGNDPNPSLMAGIHDFPQAAACKIFAHGMVGQLAFIACKNSPGIQCDHRCAEIRKALGIAFRINAVHINFPKIGLHHSPRVICPPMLCVAHCFTSIRWGLSSPVFPRIFPAFPCESAPSESCCS